MAAFGNGKRRMALGLVLAALAGIPSAADVREVRLGVKGAT